MHFFYLARGKSFITVEITKYYNLKKIPGFTLFSGDFCVFFLEKGVNIENMCGAGESLCAVLSMIMMIPASFLLQPVAYFIHSLDEVTAVLQLPPQISYIHIDRAGGNVWRSLPDPFNQFLPRQYPV